MALPTILMDVVPVLADISCAMRVLEFLEERKSETFDQDGRDDETFAREAKHVFSFLHDNGVKT